ncbi:MAG: HAMP domain-containing sensor histidine kinase [Eubacteriales bacterium]|nr:HAMP domain-containing sensor histidine kinase [Eubacteriales bacterium]
MSGKLRWKVVGLNMLFVTAVLLAIFIAVVSSARISLRQNTELQLRQALDGRMAQGGLPCFVAEVFPSGTAHISGSAYDRLDEDTLRKLVQDCMAQSEDAGVLPDYHLRYLRTAGFVTVRIAFADSSLEQATLRNLIITSLLIGLAALAVLFGCSYVLSGFVTRPVEKAWQEQRRFLSDASHELKTPLTVILSSADLLAENGENVYVDNIRSESRRMKKLVESMLTLSRADDGHHMTLMPLDWSDLLADTALLFEPVAFEAGHELRYRIEKGVQINGNDEALRQLAGILLDNAIKYAASDTPIYLTLAKRDKRAVLTVENSGAPIPPEKAARLFERFYRADESRSGGDGFGLGLSIAQSIVQEHKGTIRCECDERSTRFIVDLPLQNGGTL